MQLFVSEFLKYNFSFFYHPVGIRTSKRYRVYAGAFWEREKPNQKVHLPKGKMNEKGVSDADRKRHPPKSEQKGRVPTRRQNDGI